MQEDGEDLIETEMPSWAGQEDHINVQAVRFGFTISTKEMDPSSAYDESMPAAPMPTHAPFTDVLQQDVAGNQVSSCSIMCSG